MFSLDKYLSQILEQMKVRKCLTPTLLAEVTNRSLTSEMHFHHMRCKSTISSQQLREYEYPNELFLVMVEWNATGGSWVSSESEIQFAVVECATVDNSCSSHVDLFLDMRLMGNDTDIFSTINQKVKIYSLASLSMALSQWDALSKLHQNRLSRDLLSPRGGEYFGLKSQQLSCISPEQEHLLVGLCLHTLCEQSSLFIGCSCWTVVAEAHFPSWMILTCYKTDCRE